MFFEASGKLLEFHFQLRMQTLNRNVLKFMGDFVIYRLAEALFVSPAVKPQAVESMLRKYAAGGSFFLGRDIFLNHLLFNLIAKCYSNVGMHASLKKRTTEKDSRVISEKILENSYFSNIRK